jgi:N-acetylglutamate synthase-like GNAT family acetyltransferase
MPTCRSCGRHIAHIALRSPYAYELKTIRTFLGTFQSAGLTEEELRYAIVATVPNGPHGERIIGFLAAIPCPDASIYLCRLKVLRAFRRQGIGKMLVSCVLEVARRAGVPHAFAVTIAHAPASVLFANLGFTTIPLDTLRRFVPAPLSERYQEGTHEFWMRTLTKERNSDV